MTDACDVARTVELSVCDLGGVAYGPALELQRRLVGEVARSRGGGGPRRMHLLLLEHVPPVITIPARRGASNHLIATGSQLRGAGVQVAPTDRGGDITYHGPGQLVAYPILDLNALGLRLHEYMRFLEQAVMDVLDGFGIAAHRVLGATGVWVGGGAAARRDPPAIGRGPQPLAKICAMGVRVSRWVSMHGLALNVTTDLSHFDLIVPCGLAGLGVTSMERELGARCPAMPQVKAALADVMRRHLRLGRPADQSASIASSFRTSSVMSSASG